MQSGPDIDLLVIGGGVNGAGIARDAAGRGLRVVLAEKGDLAHATSSASSKLIHGGLRYLEHYAFRLVREALAEREVLLAGAPHIMWPLRFVLPHVPELRRAWMIRAGLFLYDRLGGRSTLPGSQGVRLGSSPYGRGLQPHYDRGFVYSDGWVDDARLVVLNARDAADRGAEVLVRTAVVSARRDGARWRALLRDAEGRERVVHARAVVNAAGPWARQMLDGLHLASPCTLRLIKGSHIVVPRRYEGAHAFILQNVDRRVVFVLPYERNFTLIGTTDIPFDGDPAAAAITPEETRYLCEAANRYLAMPTTPADVVWSYAGVRPLYDDGKEAASEVTRDYVLELDAPPGGAPALSVFGGKITTYRRLSEHALEKLAPFFPGLKGAWTARAALPGGDMPGGFEAFATGLASARPWLPREHARGLARRHGTRASRLLEGARGLAELGEHFGAGLYAREVDFLCREEWAREADDILYRRTKSGLHLDVAARERVAAYLAGNRPS